MKQKQKEREIKILRLFVHPHIIRLYEVVETHSNIYVVMEYMNRGELFDYITEKSRLKEDEARFFFQQIISGMEFCHHNMVVHRDLKPENLLLDSKGNVKIADFGLGNVMRDGHFLKTSCGSPNYAAPEVISGQLYAGPEVDIWSCGVILYALLCGRLPFDVDNIPSLYKKIKSGIYTLPGYLSPGARDLISRILVVDPIKRITIPMIRQHLWFREHLPRYLAMPAVDAMHMVKKIDEEILQVVVDIGFDRSQVIECLQSKMQNQATVTYYLLWDNRFRASSGFLRAEFEDSSLNNLTPTLTSHSSERHRYVDYQDICSSSNLQAEKKWALGLQSQASPCEIMTEVLKALQSLNVCWKKIGHYTMKCKWLPHLPCYSAKIPLHMGQILKDETTILEDGKPCTLSNTTVQFEMQVIQVKCETSCSDRKQLKPHLMMKWRFGQTWAPKAMLGWNLLSIKCIFISSRCFTRPGMRVIFLISRGYMDHRFSSWKCVQHCWLCFCSFDAILASTTVI
ncbi:SNF1-related protein kinase catalytic subunit alpha KIN10-like isoform X2 [Aristolochia californica]|uniref:SNF1-related protein kinase catalytic subunit alpha KIN10-like isoform X2 n=1 Tax=Aristolochia californica TaxID=171875 RepID=UPI0035DFC02E